MCVCALRAYIYGMCGQLSVNSLNILRHFWSTILKFEWSFGSSFLLCFAIPHHPTLSFAFSYAKYIHLLPCIAGKPQLETTSPVQIFSVTTIFIVFDVWNRRTKGVWIYVEESMSSNEQIQWKEEQEEFLFRNKSFVESRQFSWVHFNVVLWKWFFSWVPMKRKCSVIFELFWKCNKWKRWYDTAECTRHTNYRKCHMHFVFCVCTTLSFFARIRIQAETEWNPNK